MDISEKYNPPTYFNISRSFGTFLQIIREVFSQLNAIFLVYAQMISLLPIFNNLH